MEKQSLETTDIFRGAFFLCNGGDLCGIRIKDNGKRIATFMIKGDGLDKLDKAYRSGPRSQIRDLRQALVNPLEFRESLNHLRDILFDKLRENDPPTPRLRRAGGRTRYDREREDRRAQKEH